MTNRIVVLGGGVSGLSAAYFLARGLAKKNIRHEITLLERGGRLGGRVQSVRAGNGVFELGTGTIGGLGIDGFSGRHALKLAQELGLRRNIISSSTQDLFLYENEQLHPTRNQLTHTHPLLWSLKGLYMAGKMPRTPQLLESLITSKELSNTNLFRRAKAENWKWWSLRGGLGGFIEGLQKGCLEKNVKILNNSSVHQLTVRNDQKFTVEFQSQDSEALDDVDHVISTVPAHSLSEILARDGREMSESQEILQDIGSRLRRIKFVDVGVVGLEYKGAPEDILPRIGLGHVVPFCEESKVLDILYNSCIFPDHDRAEFPTTRLTCRMGGSWFEELFGDPEKVKVHDLEEAALESVSKQLGITSEPITVVSRLHRKIIPCYRVGHTDLVEGMEDALKENEIPLHLGGSSYWRMVNINDRIYFSRFIAEDIIKKLEKSLK